jgi:lycopene cyclase CruA
MAVAPTKYSDARADAPDLSHFRRNYPLTVANFGALPDREAWLRRVWLADSRWRALAEERPREAVTRSAPPPGLQPEADFDVIYAGGALALLHAGLVACRHGRRALVLRAAEDEGRASARRVAEEDLREFERAGLLTREEIEGAVVCRYRAGYVKFHDAASRVKTPPLWVSGVSDVSVDARRLAASAAEKIRAREGCAVVEGARFVRAYVERGRVSVEVEGLGGARRLFSARLLIDAAGADSAVARQLNGGRAATHVSPSVGTVARGRR